MPRRGEVRRRLTRPTIEGLRKMATFTRTLLSEEADDFERAAGYGVLKEDVEAMRRALRWVDFIVEERGEGGP